MSGSEKRAKGYVFEKDVERFLIRNGYLVRRTGESVDFGVDLIAVKSGEKDIAIQCKSEKGKKSCVSSVQEVYAGGRFYGLERFAVISKCGFSRNAMNMASRLGVYLCDYDGGVFCMPSDMERYAEDILPVYNDIHDGFRKYYEINGKKKTLANWCFEYGTNEETVRSQMKRGLSLENALKYGRKHAHKQYTVNGYTGTLAEICKHYGVLAPTVSYRMNHGMTIDEAVFAIPKIGRPRKNSEK